MSLKEQLEGALKDAMRANDDLRKRTVRMVLSAIRLAEVEKSRDAVLDEAAVMAIVQKEIKARQEAIADAQRAGRDDLIEVAKDEIGVLESFLPKQLAADELQNLVRQAIAEVGATSVREMGQVMKVLMPRIAGRAAGDQVSQAVRQLLQ